MSNDIDPAHDIIDVREVIERVEELREERDGLEVEAEEAQEKSDATGGEDQEAADALALARKQLADWKEENDAELASLEGLLGDLAGYGGDHQWGGQWYPVSLIRDSYFEDHARELAEDTGAISRDATWPNNHIDWPAAARDLQQDYSSVEFGGVTFWYR